MKVTCTICHELDECKSLPLYVNGSEGTQLCLQCELNIVHIIRTMRVLAGRAMNMGYKMAHRRGKEGV